MKRMMLTMAMALVSLVIMAQDNEKQGKRPEKKFDKTEMVKKRTDEVVKKYGLDSKQAKQLLALNTKYADKMKRPERPGRGPRGGRFGGMKPPKDQDAKPQQAPKGKVGKDGKDGKVGKAPHHHHGERQQLTAEQKARLDTLRKERTETMKAYDAELEKIMTADQFSKYKADMKKKGPQGKRGHGEKK